MMNAAWNLQGDAAQYKQYSKGWAGETEQKRPQTSGGGGYQRKNVDPDGQPTLRSGMVSSEFPFGSSKYYENAGSATLGLGNPKLYQDQDRGKFNQITGMESQNNPFVTNINTQYDKHVNTTQKPNEYQKPLGTMAQ
jgi:hypothetical protein